MAKGNCQFKGNGGQYVVTVLIHLFLLGTITLGLYFAWAWVRLIQLKASHTTMNHKAVRFNGTGGQLFVLALIQGLLTLVTFGIYGPWALCRFFSWRAEHTEVGGKPSRFTGTGGSLFLFYLVHLLILPMLTLGIYYFWGIYRLYAWKEEHTLYGGEKTSFGGRFGHFLWIAILCWILNMVTLNLFTPWALCRFYGWQVGGLVVGDGADIEHFPPVKTSIVAVIVLIVIGLLPLLALGFFIKGALERSTSPLGKKPMISGRSAKAFRTERPRIPSGPKGSVEKPPRVAVKPAPAPAAPKKRTVPGIEALTPPKDDRKEMERLDGILQGDPTNAEAFFERALVHAFRGDLPKAEEDLSKAISLETSYGDAFYNRGLVYVAQGRYEKAVQDFSKAIDLDPDSADVYCNRGNARFHLKQYDAAIEDYATALKLDPADADLYYNRGVALLAAGQGERAAADLAKAAQMGQERAREYVRRNSSVRSGDTGADIAPRWSMDLAKVEISDDTVTGQIHGQPFTLEDAQMENGVLTLREGEDFFADREIVAFLFLEKGETPERKRFNITTESGFGSPHIHMKYRVEGKDIPETEVFMKGYAMRLEFGEAQGGVLPGKIYLCLPDQEKSFMAGAFSADIH